MRPIRGLAPALIALMLGVAHAQDPVVIGGMTVARIREKGRFESVTARVAQIDKWIADVISYEDTRNPKLSMARKDGVLHIYCKTRPVIDVYPADAKASNTDEISLAKMWLKNIREALPRSTPVSRLPARPPKPGEAPAPPAPRAPTGVVTPSGSVTPAGGEPVTGVSGQAPGASTQPTGEIVPKPEPAPLPTPDKTPRSSALLMVLETMNLVRTLPEAEYLEGRDRLASNLLENLEPFMAQARETGEAAGTPQPPRPTLIETPEPPKPSTPSTPPKPVTAGGGVPTIPRVPTVPTVPTTPSGGSVKPTPTVPTAAGSDTARVPQKQRIKRKFAAAEQPFMALKNAGDPKADEVSQLLKDSRSAYTDGDFDTSETKIDQALRLMGVPIPN
ncbi:MAG: hypothetical protein FJX75_05060 [Armatimonadetes bacterium]|nr:hypothetical protein [Armatimonadota bacterium]